MITLSRPAFRPVRRAAALLVGLVLVAAVAAPLAQMAAQISAL